MVTRPKIPEYFSIIEREDRIIFHSPEKNIHLTGGSVNIVKKILPFLNGENTLEEIKYRAEISENELEKVLQVLAERKIVFDKEKTDNQDFSDNQDTLFFARKVGYNDRFEPIKKLKESEVLVIGNGSLGKNVVEFLVSSGVEKVNYVTYGDEKIGNKINNESINRIILDDLKEIQNHEAFNSNLLVLCTDSLSPDLHSQINKICLEKSRMWLSARLCGNYGEVGPLVIPGKTPCYTCYDYRVKSNMDNLGEYLIIESFLMGRKQVVGGLDSLSKLIASQTCAEIVRILTGYDNPLTLGRMLYTDFNTGETTSHRILKVPHCPTCGR